MTDSARPPHNVRVRSRLKFLTFDHRFRYLSPCPYEDGEAGVKPAPLRDCNRGRKPLQWPLFSPVSFRLTGGGWEGRGR